MFFSVLFTMFLFFSVVHLLFISVFVLFISCGCNCYGIRSLLKSFFLFVFCLRS